MSVVDPKIKSIIREETILAVKRAEKTIAAHPLSIAAFARRIGRSRTTVYVMIANNEVRTVQINGHKAVPHSEIDRILSTPPAEAI